MLLDHAKRPFPVVHHSGWRPLDPSIEAQLASVPFPTAMTQYAVVALPETKEALVSVCLFDRETREARFVLRGAINSGADLKICLQEAESLARLLGTTSLVSQEKIPADFAAAPHIFRSSGFTELCESWTFECPFAALADRSEQVYAKLLKKGIISKNANVDSVDNRFAEVRAILDASRMMDGFDFDARLSGRSLMAISGAHSRVIRQRQDILGILLVAPCTKPGTYEVANRWVAEKARRSWVNEALIHSCIRKGLELGAEYVRFNANADNHRETIRLAEHANGSCIGYSHRYGKRIG